MSVQKLPLRLLGLLAMVAVPAVAAVGCGDDDDDKKPTVGDGDGNDDAGTDAGDGDGDGDGNEDAGTDAGDGEGLSCGGNAGESTAVTCDSATIAGSVTLDACCTDDPELVCGLDMTAVEEVTNRLFSGCVARNQPSVPADKKTSTFCTGFLENIDAPEEEGTATNGFSLPIAAINQTLNFEGCCRVNDAGDGECGIVVDEILGAQVGFGCLPLDTFRGAFPSEAQFEAAKAQAVCDKETGEAVAN